MYINLNLPIGDVPYQLEHTADTARSRVNALAIMLDLTSTME